MYFLTFTEMTGANGEVIAKQVASKLGYAYLGDQELLEKARHKGTVSEILKLDEKVPTLLQRVFSERPKIYLDRLQSMIYDEAKKGDTVFFGKGSQLLLNSFECALHILVTGSFQKRVQRVMEGRGIPREVAEKFIERSDHEKRGFIQFAFDEDWLDPKFYDLIVNTDKLSVDSAVKMITDSAKSKEIRACGVDSMNLLGKLSLHRKLEAALLEAEITSSHLFFSVESADALRLYGIADSPEEKERVEQVAKKIDGVKHVENDIKVFRGDMVSV